MRTQPQEVIAKLEADNSRLAKEKILLDAMNEGLDEFFEGLKMCLDKLYTFGVKQVPTKDEVAMEREPIIQKDTAPSEPVTAAKTLLILSVIRG